MYILMQVFKRFITSQFGHYYTFYFDTENIWRGKEDFSCHLKMNVCQATFFIALNAIKVILTFI